jgi:predicted nucleic acid-binding protein
MSLGDATIAATALVNKMPIATHNVTDFQWIPNLVVIDPIKRI